MRSPSRSRYYIQVPLGTRVEDWPDALFWDELRRRLPAEVAADVTPGAAFETSVAPLRSFVAEPMRFGRLLLAGDAAHIVPPTGAKGLNLAASDVHYLFEGAARRTTARVPIPCSMPIPTEGAGAGLEGGALLVVDDDLLHRFPDEDALAERLRRAELDYLLRLRGGADGDGRELRGAAALRKPGVRH